MKAIRVLAAVAIASAVLSAPAAAKGAGGPLVPTSAPEAGVAGPSTDQPGPLRYSVFPDSTQRSSKLLAIETDGGEIDARYSLEGRWALPAVTTSGEPGGLSADGRTLVLTEPIYTLSQRRTGFLIVDTEHIGDAERISLPGKFGFDAISPDGRTIFLIEYRDPANPLNYRVRALDVTTGRLDPGEIVDPAEPDERMAGQPVARAASPDGRWAYTAYAGGRETFIHALDTEGKTAVCVDLEEIDPQRAFGLDLAVAAGGAITVLRRDEPVATVSPGSFEVTPVAGEPASADDGSFPWLLVALAAVGLAAGAALAARLRRRRDEESELAAVFAAASAEGEAEREREAEPVP